MMFLTKEELVQLTGRKVNRSQVMVLRAMGIEHRVRPEGSVVVLRAHVEKQFGGGEESRKKEKPFEPDWSGVNA
jgi:hypothetical protein